MSAARGARPGVDRALRVLHCPWNVAGHSAGLAAAERALGADSRCVVLDETAKGFPADERLCAPGASLAAREAARWRLVARAARWADVVHFSFGQSCLTPNAFPSLSGLSWRDPVAVARRLYARAVWMKDLPALSALGKGLAVSWQGDDARQRDRSLELFDVSIAQHVDAGYYPPGSDDWKRRTIAVFDRRAPLHYALNPDLLHVLPKRARHLPYATVDVAALASRPPEADGVRPLVLAHAPSHRNAKGTGALLAALDQLRGEGLRFELDLVEGLPRDEAMARYARCDVMIDQLYAGWYGGLAVEAMALGKPVCAFIREADLALVDPALARELPLVRLDPADPAAALRALLRLPRGEIAALGARSRAFVERFHDPRAVAARTLADYSSLLENRSV